MYDEDGYIYSKNYFGWNLPDDIFYIISEGTGCFQVHYLEDNYFIVDKKNKLFTKSFNVLNSEAVQFQIFNNLESDYSQGKDNKITIYIYCSEKNFVKELKIDEKYQELEIHTKKDLYYYEIDYTEKSESYIIDLGISFNLNNKNYITFTLKIKLHYTNPIVWMFVTFGCVAMLIVLLFGIGYILEYCKKRKIKREELNKQLIQRVERNKKVKQHLNLM